MVMTILSALVLIVCGVLAAANLIIAKRPDATAVIDKLRPAQGIVGAIALLWGVWTLISCIIGIGAITFAPISWLVTLAVGVVETGLGFLLAYPLLQQYALSKNADAARQGEATRARLVAYQTPLGLAGIALGVLAILVGIVGRGGGSAAYAQGGGGGAAGGAVAADPNADFVEAAPGDAVKIADVVADPKKFAGKTVSFEAQLDVYSGTPSVGLKTVKDAVTGREGIQPDDAKKLDDGGFVAWLPPGSKSQGGKPVLEGDPRALNLHVPTPALAQAIERRARATSTDEFGTWLVTAKIDPVTGLSNQRTSRTRAGGPGNEGITFRDEIGYPGTLVDAKPIYAKRAMAAGRTDARDVTLKPELYAGKTVTSELTFGGDTGEPIPADGDKAANGGWTQWSAPGTKEQIQAMDRSQNFELMLFTPTVALRDKWRDVQSKSKDQYSTFAVTYTVGKPAGVKMDHLQGTLVDVKLK